MNHSVLYRTFQLLSKWQRWYFIWKSGAWCETYCWWLIWNLFLIFLLWTFCFFLTCRFSPEVGTLVCVHYKETFVRAVILQTDYDSLPTKTALVRFIDYGDHIRVDLKTVSLFSRNGRIQIIQYYFYDHVSAACHSIVKSSTMNNLKPISYIWRHQDFSEHLKTRTNVLGCVPSNPILHSFFRNSVQIFLLAPTVRTIFFQNQILVLSVRKIWQPVYHSAEKWSNSQ